MNSRYWIFFSLILATLAAVVQAEDPQREIIAQLRSARIPVKVHESKLIGVSLQRQRDVSRWLSKLSGCESLEALNLSRTSVSPEDIAILATFPRLRAVDLSQTELSAQAAAELANCAALKELDLSGAP